MEINGIEYIKKEKMNKIIIENDSLRKENKKIIEVIRKILPISEEDVNHLINSYGLTYMRHKIIKDGCYKNERLEYETEISELKNEITSLKSKLSKLEKQYKGNESGQITLKKTNEAKLKQIQKLINEVLD